MTPCPCQSFQVNAVFFFLFLPLEMPWASQQEERLMRALLPPPGRA